MTIKFDFEETVSLMAGLEIYRQNYVIEQYMDGIEDQSEVPEIDLGHDQDYQSILSAMTKVGIMLDMHRKASRGNVR